jgi:hypothetical protein
MILASHAIFQVWKPETCRIPNRTEQKAYKHFYKTIELISEIIKKTLNYSGTLFDA